MTEPAIIKLAILAVGGQGGGVLTNWIVELAESAGWRAQSTAVAGVAQRTGATIYYVEMAPETGRDPVFALAPAPGDVDILIAAEWMEAGRAVMRGFVTPDRTTLIASTHRALAVSEKVVPGDGSADSAEVAAVLDQAAARVIAFDMQAPAVAAGSVISATLFGALAASGALPFAPECFEDVIRAGGRGVDASLAAFAAGRDGRTEGAEVEASAGAARIAGPARATRDWQDLAARAAALPDPVAEMAVSGLARVVDFQDTRYGEEYLRLVEPFTRGEPALGMAAAKHIANAMAYGDVIGVADQKTRAERRARIEAEMATDGRLMHLTEFLHPRGEEIVSLLPRRIGAWIVARPGLAAWIDRRVNRGRRVRSDTVLGFSTLYVLAGLKRWRRGTLRHQVEMAHIAAWLETARRVVPDDPALAVEILNARRLVKGYSDTHARGTSKFDRVLGALALLAGRDDAADWVRRLIAAALKDAEGEALDGALKTIRSFADG